MSARTLAAVQAGGGGMAFMPGRLPQDGLARYRVNWCEERRA